MTYAQSQPLRSLSIHITRCLCDDANNALALIGLFRPKPHTMRPLISAGSERSLSPSATPDQIEVAGLKGVKSGQVFTVRRESR